MFLDNNTNRKNTLIPTNTYALLFYISAFWYLIYPKYTDVPPIKAFVLIFFISIYTLAHVTDIAYKGYGRADFLIKG